MVWAGEDGRGCMPDEMIEGGYKRASITSHVAHISWEPQTQIGKFIHALENGEEYQPVTRIGQFLGALKALADRGASGVEIDLSTIEKRDGEPSRDVEFDAPPVTNGPTAPTVELETIPPTVEPEPNLSPLAQAMSDMAAGRGDAEDIRVVEEASRAELEALKEEYPEQSRDLNRALNVMEADGQISGNEYRVFQAVVEKAIESGTLTQAELDALPIQGKIDTVEEVGAALGAINAAKEQAAAQGL